MVMYRANWKKRCAPFASSCWRDTASSSATWTDGSGNNTSGTWSATLTGLTEGSHTLAVIATDAAANSGGSMDAADIYPTWLDDDTVLYLRLRAVYGTACKNFELVAVNAAQGGKVKNLQTAIEEKLKD